MPGITFNLAGKDFTLSPYDNAFMSPGPDHCVAAILFIGMPKQDHSEIVLGSAFLRSFYADNGKEYADCLCSWGLGTLARFISHLSRSLGDGMSTE